MGDGMLALTLWPEWAAAVAHLGKRVENRGPESPRWLRRAVGQRIAIHAGKHIGGRPSREAYLDGLCAVADTARLALDEHVDVLAPVRPNARLAAEYAEESDLDNRTRPAILRRGESEYPIVTGAIVATAVLGEPHRPTGQPWEQDDPEGWCWPLSDVVPLRTPIACRGAQGLWPSGFRWYSGIVCPLCGIPPKWHANGDTGHADCQDGYRVSRRFPGIGEPCEWEGARIRRVPGGIAFAEEVRRG